MLKRHEKIHQSEQEIKKGLERIWYMSDYFDFIYWLKGTEVYQFQLCYDKKEHECTIHWNEEEGVKHFRIAGGGHNANSNKSPVFEPIETKVKSSVVMQFMSEGTALDSKIINLVMDKIGELNKGIIGSSAK